VDVVVGTVASTVRQEPLLKGMLSTVDHLIKLGCFVIKEKN
jgi:hypothetical protein